ncbi:MAG: sulfotransferase [bacterium]
MTDKDKNDIKKEGAHIGKDFYFIGGLPRAGSTLLCNILAQNPRLHTTSTSGVMDIMFIIRNNWDNLVEFKATPNEPAKIRVLRGVLENFYSDVDKPVVIDKSRSWISVLEMAESILGHKAKVIVPVRDIRDILASFEKLWRIASETKQIKQEKDNYFKFQTIEGRADVWLQNNQPVGIAYNRIKDAVTRGFKDRMLFVDFDKLTSDPKVQIKRIYDFFGEEYFEHDFNNVKQVTWEDDSVHGFANLHSIRPKVEKKAAQWPSVLGNFAEGFGKLNFWQDYI